MTSEPATTARRPAPRRRTAGRLGGLGLLAVLGPGLLAGLSDDDPAGITTYSVLGADHGYRLLWVLLLATVALVVYHDLGARMGVVTGQGLVGLVRHRYGVRVSGLALLTLVVANVGTAAAEFAGVAAGSELLGVSRWVSVPLAAVVVTTLVLAGSFHRVEHVLIALASVFVAYVASGLLAHPDWGAALSGLVVPRLGGGHGEALVVAATVGTTLAPWGLSFIQSYAVDKKLTVADLRDERVDVVIGATLTGVIGFFVVVACAATLHRSGVHVQDAADAARALSPLAGDLASLCFAVGLLGAALLAAAVLPLSTAYAVCDWTGSEAALDCTFREAPLFYTSTAVVTALGAGAVLLPGVPLVPLLVWTQMLNAVLLLPLLVLMCLLARDREVLGEHVVPRPLLAVQLVVLLGVLLCTVLVLTGG